MLKFITDFIKRLSSRKFLITLGGISAVVTFPEQAGEIVTLCVTFIGAEGVGDAVERYKHEDVKKAEIQLKDTKLQLGELNDLGDGGVDRSVFTTGADIPMQ